MPNNGVRTASGFGRQRRRRRSKGVIAGERLNDSLTTTSANRRVMCEDLKWKSTSIGFGPRQKLLLSEDCLRRTQMDQFFVKRCTLHKDLKSLDDELFELRSEHNATVRFRTIMDNMHDDANLQNRFISNSGMRDAPRSSATSTHATKLHEINKYFRSYQNTRVDNLKVDADKLGLEGLDGLTSPVKKGFQLLDEAGSPPQLILPPAQTSPHQRNNEATMLESSLIHSPGTQKRAPSAFKGTQFSCNTKEASQKKADAANPPGKQRPRPPARLNNAATFDEIIRDIPKGEYKLFRERSSLNLKEKTDLLIERKKLYKQFLAFEVCPAQTALDALPPPAPSAPLFTPLCGATAYGGLGLSAKNTAKAILGPKPPQNSPRAMYHK